MFSRDDHQWLRIFARVGQAIHTGKDLEAILQSIIEQIQQAFNAKGCTIRTLDPATGDLKLLAAVGMSTGYLEKGPIKSSMRLTEIFEKEPVFIEDIRHDPMVQYPEAALAEGIVSLLGFPFQIVGSHRMVLRIYFSQRVRLNEDDLAFIRSLVEQCAIAIRYSLLQSRYFETFRQVSSAIHRGTDTAQILQTIVGRITDIMEAKGCIFWILNTAENRIETKVSFGFPYQSLMGVDYETLWKLFDPQGGQPVFIEDARYDERIPNLERLGKKHVISVAGLPLQIAEPYVGVLAVYFGHHRPLMRSELEFLQALGEQGAISLYKALRYDEKMLDTFRQTVEGLVLALEAKDAITHGHSLRVAHYAKLTAAAMGLPDKQVKTLYHAGLLHDIGKIGMQDKILTRLGKLKAREMDSVRRHPVIGARILGPLTFMSDIVPLVRHHHERYNGSGYPQGLKGDQIPLGARILGVCDAFETMITGRPNIPRMSVQSAIQELLSKAGVLFDPRVAQTWVDLVKSRPESLSPPQAPVDLGARYDELAGEDFEYPAGGGNRDTMWFRFPSGF